MENEDLMEEQIMKKHVIVTVVIMLIFTLILGGVLWYRANGEDDTTDVLVSQNDAGDIQEENDDSSGETEDKAIEEEQNTATEVVLVDSEQPETEETEEPPTMLLAGDVLFATHMREHYKNAGIESVFSAELQELFRNADIAMVNQEFPFSLRGEPMKDKQYTFRIDPDFVTAFSELGVDIVSLANNHVLDYGSDALLDTFVTLDEAGIRYVGAGDSEERAKELQIFEVNGKTIGILSASRVIPVVEWDVQNKVPGVFTTYDGAKLCEEIRKAREICDFVAVYVHWGVEYDAYPQEYQKVLARQYIDAGADFVAGAHSHCLQSMEYYNGKPVFYGLGNFVFDANIERTMAVEVIVSKEGEAECRLIPAKAVNGCTMIMEPDEAEELYRYMESISEGISIDSTGRVIQQ